MLTHSGLFSNRFSITEAEGYFLEVGNRESGVGNRESGGDVESVGCVRGGLTVIFPLVASVGIVRPVTHHPPENEFDENSVSIQLSAVSSRGRVGSA